MAKLRVAECSEFTQSVTEMADEMGVLVPAAIVDLERNPFPRGRMDDARFNTRIPRPARLIPPSRSAR